MRVSMPSTARPQFQDRNPSDARVSAMGQWGPHSRTTRGTYTVPAGRRAVVTMIFLQMIRLVAASTLGDTYLRVQVTINGVARGCPVLVHRNNTVGAETHMSVGESFTMSAGDVLEVTTEDTSSGGSMQYNAQLYILEYDA